MSLIENDITRLKSLIAKGDQKEVFNILLKSLERNSIYYNELILLSNRSQQFEKRERLNLQYDPKEKNQITYDLLELITSIDNQKEAVKIDYKTNRFFIKMEKRKNIIYISLSGASLTFLLFFFGFPLISSIVFGLVLLGVAVYNFIGE